MHPDISYFRIPPQATRLFEIVLLLASRFPPATGAQHLAYSMMLLQVLGMVAISKLAATASACGQDYPEYDSRGLLAEFDGEFNFPVIPAHLSDRLANEHLEPMVQFFLYIREAFSWEPGKKTETERRALRQHIRSYLHHTEHIADIVVR
ncbi:hypothetical protein FB451DRAFT_1401900 [Mycena latifolia]|nr:hypothetical protein FB451DRAFT_1401900 [Mycena latifolia]